ITVPDARAVLYLRFRDASHTACAYHPTVVAGIHRKRYGDVRRNVFSRLGRVFLRLQEHGSERQTDATQRGLGNDHGDGKKSMRFNNEPAEVKFVVERITQDVILFLCGSSGEVAQGDSQKTHTTKVSCHHGKAFYLILSSRQHGWHLNIMV